MRIANLKGIIPYTEKLFSIELNGKHLILTGKNGSGKTQLLQSIYDFLKTTNASKSRIINAVKQFEGQKESIERDLKQNLETKKQLHQNILAYESQLKNQGNPDIQEKLQRQKDTLVNVSKRIQDSEQKLLNKGRLSEEEISRLLTFERHSNKKELTHQIKFELLDFLDPLIPASKLRLFFNSYRASAVNRVDSVTPSASHNQNLIQEKNNILQGHQNSRAGDYIEQYLVDWEVNAALHQKQGNLESSNKLESWKNELRDRLKILLDDKSTDLKFNIDRLTYSITQHEKMDFSFRDLSSGYSSIFKVFSEILMYLEVADKTPVEQEGVILIDEIDAHLHPSLQKQILPFFIKLFPKLQFIVTTHAPFIVNSVKNAVVYDLSTQQIVEHDLRLINIDNILSSIFKVSDKSEWLLDILNSLGDEEFLAKNQELIIELIDNNRAFLDDESLALLLAAKNNLRLKNVQRD